MNKMQVLVEKRRLVLVPEKREEVNEVVLPYVATVIKNLQSYGYALSESVIEVLKTLSVDEVVSFYKDLKSILDVMTGNDKITEPMYPNFPTQVMELDYIELFINAFIHYVSNGTILPEYEKEERFPLVENPEQKLNVLDLGTEEDFFNIFTNLVGAKGSISQSDKELVAEYVTTYKNDIIPYMPESITMKETLSFVTDLFLNTEGVNAGKALLLYYKTATDVLRLAVALSKGDVSLKENTKFKSFTRKERKMLLTMLDNIQYLLEH